LPALRHCIFTGDGPPPDGFYSYDQLLAAAGADFPATPIVPADLAALFYTSGTTGHPKGVMLSHANLLANAYHVLSSMRWQEGEVYLHACPMFHIADGPTSHFITWLGGTHVIIPAFKPDLALEVMERERVTATLMIPTMINFLIHHPDVSKRDLSALRHIAYGGSPMPAETARQAMQMLPCAFTHVYGLTEAAPMLTCLPPEQHVADGPPEKVRRLLSCGREVIGVRVRVVTPQGRDVEPGEVGEIIAKGPNNMVGYWNKPQETANALRHGWLYTGDLATVDAEGYIYIVDRKKEMLVSGGFNVYPTEVESVLAQHPAVYEVCVIGVPDDHWGERPLGVVVSAPGSQATPDELRRFLSERVAGWQVPERWAYVPEIPKTSVGKFDKKALRNAQAHDDLDVIHLPH
jgi:long-chain acyl-CoA synthetase